MYTYSSVHFSHDMGSLFLALYTKVPPSLLASTCWLHACAAAVAGAVAAATVAQHRALQ
jgi:hypothetical protein